MVPPQQVGVSRLAHSLKDLGANVGPLYTNAIRSWLLRIVKFSLVASVPSPPVFGSHEGSFGSQHTMFLADEECMWKFTWQVCIMLVGILGVFIKAALEGRLDETCSRNLGLH